MPNELLTFKPPQIRPQQLSPDMLMDLIRRDSGLSMEERVGLMQTARQPGFMQKLLAGASGAAVAYAISKYMGLSKGAQILLAFAGFGVGRLLLDYSQSPNDTLKYNRAIQAYEVKY